VAGSCECGDEPSGSTNVGNFLSNLRCFSFSGRTLLHGISKYLLCSNQKLNNQNTNYITL
jgi:hypothetical protein